MRYEWDEHKNDANVAKHGFHFEDAERVFLSDTLEELDDRFDYGEDRWIAFGMLDGRVVQVVYTEADQDTRRIISLRKAIRYEQNDYAHFLQDRLGQN